MKKLYNNTPLGTVLYCVSGLQPIKIVDVDDTRWDSSKTILYDGLKKDWWDAFPNHGLSVYMVEHSAVYGIDVAEDGTLVFTIHTKYEEY